MNQSLEEIFNVSAATGPFGKGDAVLEQTLRDFIQLQSTTLAVGTKVVGVRTVPWLAFTWYTGVQGTFTYPLDDNAIVDPTKVGTANYSVELAKGQGRCTFLDSTLLRGESWDNMSRQQLGITQARADLIDNHILTTLKAGAGQTQAATAVWGTGSADEEQDILDSMDKIFENARVSGNERLALILPATCRAQMLNTRLYTNVLQSLTERLNTMMSLDVYFTRDHGTGGALGNDALLLIPGAETAEFFQYNGPGYQETELTRLPGVGFDWLLTSYMGSVVHEHQDGASAGTNNRIVKITGVIS
tara:strand:+ start:174 stop:1082 length:909 start_codon:yes stop_codon:yes gene_type:complete